MRPTLPTDRRRLAVWSGAAAALVWAAMAAPALLGRVYTRDDLGAFHLPARHFYAQRLAAGEPFDWMPSLYCGFYVTGEGQAGMYHPWHVLLYRFLPLPAAFNLEALASYPVLFAGMFLWLRRLVGRADAALFGSLVFTFGSFNLLHFVHPNAVATVAHVPWLLWAIGRLAADPPRASGSAFVAAIALLTGSQMLLGYPQYVWFSLLAEAAYAVLVVAGRASRAGRWFGRLVVAKGIGVLIGAVQLLPTADALAGSTRREVSAAWTNSGSLDPLNLAQWVAPYLFAHRVVGENTHELGVYLGAIPLVLIAWLLPRWRLLGPLRRPAAAALGLGLLALLLALGQHGYVYPLQRLLPLVGNFRFPCRYTVLLQMSAAVLAAIGWVLLTRQGAAACRVAAESGRRKADSARGAAWASARLAGPTLSPLGVVFGLSLLAAAVGQSLSDRPFIAAWPAIWAGPLLIGSAAVLVVLAGRGLRPAMVGLVLLGSADLGWYGLSYAVYPETYPLPQWLAATPVPPGECRGRVLADLAGGHAPAPRTGNEMTMLGWQRADGYAGLEPARQLDFRQLPALRLAGVEWVRRTEASEQIDGLLAHDARWLRVPGPLPRARLAPEDGAAEKVAVVSDRPGRIHLEVDSPGRRLLVVSESHHSGWRAWIDGSASAVLRVDGDFLGCMVEPGRHEVVLEFRPRSLCYGRMVSLIGVGLAGACALHSLVGLRRRLK